MRCRYELQSDQRMRNFVDYGMPKRFGWCYLFRMSRLVSFIKFKFSIRCISLSDPRIDSYMGSWIGVTRSDLTSKEYMQEEFLGNLAHSMLVCNFGKQSSSAFVLNLRLCNIQIYLQRKPLHVQTPRANCATPTC